MVGGFRWVTPSRPDSGFQYTNNSREAYPALIALQLTVWLKVNSREQPNTS